jgi:4-amino-4-deoxychorismate lyase
MPVVVTISRPSVDSTHTDAPAFKVVPFDAPVVDAMNLGITRGDGIFETIGIVNGVVQDEEAHLRRFARSAEILELPVPDPNAYRAAVAAGVAALGISDSTEVYCKYVLTRGIESRSFEPTGYAFLDINPSWQKERTTGIGVVTLSRGYALDIAQTSPWLLQGAKTLSYAVNRAVLREAARRGADDVLFTTTDGYVLEGPTSSLLLRFGAQFVTPAPELGVLHGTAQYGAFRYLDSIGAATSYRPVLLSELMDADALWMTNSQRLAAPIHTLEGAPRTVDAEFTAALNAALLARTE